MENCSLLNTTMENFLPKVLPRAWIRYLSYLPLEKMKKLVYCRQLVTNVAQELVKRKKDELFSGKSGRDVMSLLGQFLTSLVYATLFLTL